MGMFNSYKKFIPNFSGFAKEITELTEKGVQFQWTPKRQLAFDPLKDYLTQSPILIYPDPNQEYHLFIDASNYSWSAILMQEQESQASQESYLCPTTSYCFPKWYIQGILAELACPDQGGLCYVHGFPQVFPLFRGIKDNTIA